uniref:Uncharacterized protein n=1 Tax=Ditylenchus dipsaci TaxID=166011 RepID=A0A915E586_9BILA
MRSTWKRLSQNVVCSLYFPSRNNKGRSSQSLLVSCFLQPSKEMCQQPQPKRQHQLNTCHSEAKSKSSKLSLVDYGSSGSSSSGKFGPQKPADGDYGYPAMDAIHSDSPTTSGTITDNIASEMIYKKEQGSWPHVQENLLKNLNNKVMAQVSIGPLPKVKKDPKDRLSKRKHQITHLAGLAVAREEQLQEQWAENRQKKKANDYRQFESSRSTQSTGSMPPNRHWYARKSFNPVDSH